MKFRSKAPFRIGLAGGGTDVSPYSDNFGGAILNATINLYAYTTIIPTENEEIVFKCSTTNKEKRFNSVKELLVEGDLILQIGVYNRLIKDFNLNPLSFEMTTNMDVPTGSGLGTSSTLVVSIIGAFVEWLKLPLGEYDIAQLAYSIEREDLKMEGGKQDQYAATFGGINFMEFYEGNKVVVNPLRIKTELIEELQLNLILYYTQKTRESSTIIKQQMENTLNNKTEAVEAMHTIKEQAFLMKQALLKEDLNELGVILNQSWENKKRMAKGITNPVIDEIYASVIEAGAIGGKISGAGGGGFMIFYCTDESKFRVIKTLSKFGGEVKSYQFTNKGLTHWTVK